MANWTSSIIENIDINNYIESQYGLFTHSAYANFHFLTITIQDKDWLWEVLNNTWENKKRALSDYASYGSYYGLNLSIAKLFEGYDYRTNEREILLSRKDFTHTDHKLKYLI